MTAFEDRNAATSLRLITKYGKAITVQRPATDAVYDTQLGEFTGGTPVDPETVRAIVKDFNNKIDNVGLLLQSGDKQILIAAKNFVKPFIGVTFTVDDDTYTVVPIKEGGLEVETIFAQDTAVLYRVHGRKT